MHFCFLSSNLANWNFFFRSTIFISGWKEKTDLTASNNANGERNKKKTGLKREETDWNWEILHKSIYAHLHKRKLLSPRAKVLFFFLFFVFAGTSLFSYIFFFRHRNETKAMNFTKHRRETSLLHTLSHKCLKSFNFIILL